MPSFINRQLAVNPHRKKGGKMYFAKVFITLRESILDPAGIAVENTLHKLGFSEANNLRMGKYITFNIHADSVEKAEAQVDKMCTMLLANTIIEDYCFTLEETV